jgi:hypothetical protein
MVITKHDMRERRRELVYQLHWQGRSLREIANKIGNVSFKTIALDIEYWEKKAKEEILKQREHIALDYKEACEVYRYLLKKALEHFEKAEKANDEDRIERYFSIIESMNANLIATQANSDLIEKEVAASMKQTVEKMEKELNEVIIGEQNNDN